MTAPPLVLRPETGRAIRGDDWGKRADAVDIAVLRRCHGPVLDIGCGPGRHVLALAERGVPVLGIDLTPRVVTWARSAGVLVLERCVFDRVPATGRWTTALLLDGNVGIGGDPAALLRRVLALVAPDGHVLVEAGAPDSPTHRTAARIEVHGEAGPPFAWTYVDDTRLEVHAEAVGLRVCERWEVGGRHFMDLERDRRVGR